MTEITISDKPVLKFALVGFGYIGKKHAKAIFENPDCQLIAICDTDSSKLSESVYDVPAFTDLQTMLSEFPDLDVLSICTPNGLHTEQAKTGLENKKHVIIEKPMGLRASDCRNLIELAGKKSKKVFCVMQNRYSPPAKWLKAIVEEGRLGRIYMVNIDCFWNRDERYYNNHPWKGKKNLDGGTLFTQFSHFVDMMYWLFGDIKDIKAVFGNFNHEGLTEFEDSGSFNFLFRESQAIGNFNYSSSVWDHNMESSLTVIAEHGSIKIGGQYMNKVEYAHIKDYLMPELEASEPPNDYGSYQGSASNHHLFYENVVAALNGESSVTADARDGMKVVEIIEKVYEQNKWIK